MDLTLMGFYGAVCGVLAAAAPVIGGLWLRLISGAVVGVAAASALPLVRTSLAAMY